MIIVRRLLWDEFNVPHIAVHGITPEEVEEICSSDPVVQEGKKGRALVFGLTAAGRMVTVVLADEGEGTYYPVTASPASRRERAIYVHEKGNEDP